MVNECGFTKLGKLGKEDDGDCDDEDEYEEDA